MLGEIDHPDMTIAVDWDVKNQTKQKDWRFYLELSVVHIIGR